MSKANYEVPDSFKKRTKQTQDTTLSVIDLFSGRIKDNIICFRDLLTFIYIGCAFMAAAKKVQKGCETFFDLERKQKWL